MNTLGIIKKTRDYLDYVEEHVKNVQEAWRIIQVHCKDLSFITNEQVRSIIDEEVQNHDLSKLSSKEFVQYRNNFYPCDDEVKNTKDFDKAWEHHKHNNHHHWEMWSTKAYNSQYARYINIVHNVCDWVAMGIKFGDSAISYYENNKQEIIIDKKHEDFMYEIFNLIYDENRELKC